VWRTYHILMVALAAWISGCGPTALSLLGGGTSKLVGLSASARGQGFKDRCGAAASDMTDPSYTLLDQTMKGTVVVSGTQSDIAFSVTLGAVLKIKASAGSTVTDTAVQVVNVEADDGGRFSRPRAEAQAKANTNRRSSVGMSTATLMTLQDSDAMFKGIECAVGFTKLSQLENAEGTGLIKYTPGLPESLNPKAAASTYVSELGNARTFQAVGKILEQGPDWEIVGTEVGITAVVTKIASQADVEGMPDDAPTIAADVIYEFVFATPQVELSAIGLSKRRVFFVNTQEHTLVAVLEEQGKIDETTKEPVPPILMLKL
jgi:hypothetical protein